jgi:hypothetical protein
MLPGQLKIRNTCKKKYKPGKTQNQVFKTRKNKLFKKENSKSETP